MLEFVEFFEGRVVSKSENSFVLLTDVGVGLLFNTTTTESAAVEIGKRVRVYVAVYGEQQHYLCGFLSERTRDLFRMISAIRGVGLKTGLSLLSLGTEKLLSAISTGDAGVLCEAKGVSKKLAEKIIFELKGKVVEADHTLIDALVSLGVEREEAQRILSTLPPSLPFEDKLKEALKRFKP
jgi:Holliday junction DNA helicase RuvA